MQLLKRTEAVEKEKNDAVCRYAAREAQLMRLQKQIEELEAQKNMLSAEKNTLQKSTQFEYVQNMKHSLAEMERQLAVEKDASKEREEQHKMTVKHLEASQTILIELRSRLESAQSQITAEQIEKEECQDRLRKAQAMLKVDFLGSSLRRAELAEIAAMDAAAERDQAEAEAAKCRKETERDLRAEVQYLRKLQSRLPNSSPPNASVEDNLSITALSNGSVAKDHPSTSSQASSIASSNDVYSLTTGYSTILVSQSAAHQKKSQQFVVSSSSDEANHLQQQMIEKIVKLQRQLARRQDKIEFLEEHVRQCTQELLKKTKIIQNYALREEAALLLPESDLNKILCGPNGSCSTSSSLIGNLFTSSANGGTGKSELKFVMEVNSRLQAVLEDALHKNITLTNNIDIMGKEISRLSRENRQLALSKTM
ncbi:unnamed protein product [Onchocerca flexuosa]|uniref:Coiled-coil domain-containing protein 18 n=1 Tax=Onchocerca flexuosa TaxID=387005 RepID=A0A183HZ03_9BILA|nr:unnamed protein product [Onchocerca flexuosa]